MPENPAPETPVEPIAIVGLACSAGLSSPGPDGPGLDGPGGAGAGFAGSGSDGLDAGDLGSTQARAAGPRGAPPIRAALIEGWRFDRAAFCVTEQGYRAADPAHWLALETAARALADGGFPGGQGLTRDRTGVVIGNTWTGWHCACAPQAGGLSLGGRRPVPAGRAHGR
jgi:enediyne polyketide synthase